MRVKIISNLKKRFKMTKRKATNKMDIIKNNLLVEIESMERQCKTHSRKGKGEKISPETKKLMESTE